MQHLNTFSIVGYDPDEKAWGVAVASKFLAAAAVVSWARAGVGAVATQALAKVSYGHDALCMMRDDIHAQQVIEALIAVDEQHSQRQVGVVDKFGNAAAYTGQDCIAWAGHKTGQFFTCQGNILTGPETLDAMAGAFTQSSGELADRLMAALLAGDRVGGDRRGKQSAGLLVVRPNGGYGGDNDHYLDLRVDDDPDPVTKLSKLVSMHHTFFGEQKPDDLLPVTPALAAELQTMMLEGGYFGGDANGEWDEMSKHAFWMLISNENLEERWNLDGDTDKIDRVALEYLRERFQ